MQYSWKNNEANDNNLSKYNIGIPKPDIPEMPTFLYDNNETICNDDSIIITNSTSKKKRTSSTIINDTPAADDNASLRSDSTVVNTNNSIGDSYTSSEKSLFSIPKILPNNEDDNISTLKADYVIAPPILYDINDFSITSTFLKQVI